MTQVIANPVTMVYHELRAPLGLVATAARSAAADCTDDLVRARCELIMRTAERMLRTASQVMDIADKARQTEWETFDASHAIRSAVADLRALGASISLNGLRSGVEMFGSRDLLEALVSSLLNNAMDHAEPGSNIDCMLTTVDSQLLFELRNTPSAARRHRGLGLGLYICQQLVAELRGTLSTEVHEGSFRTLLRLPRTMPASLAS